jgi:CDP-glycerol glycerophosphotransferase (TagB/SpsB family)
VLKHISSVIGALLRALMFLPRALLYRGKCVDTAVEFRESRPDSDTIPLLQVIARKKPGSIIWIIADKPEVTRPYLPMLAAQCADVELRLAKQSQTFIRAKTLFLTNNPNTERYMVRLARLLNPGQKYYRINHGLITKRLPAEVRYGGKTPRRRSSRPMDGVICQNMIESYRRSYSNGVGLHKMLQIGFPRFYRAQQLRNGSVVPALPESTVAKIGNEGFRIMYAPTRSGSLSKLPGFDSGELRAWLETHNATLYLKTHVLTKAIHGFDELGDRVVDLSRETLIGSLDILSQMHALVTDTSSIMMEGFSLQMPVIHVLVDHLDIAGMHDVLAYDENISVPGLVARDFQSVLTNLDQAIAGDKCYEFANAVWHLVPTVSIDETYGPIIQ